MNDEEENQALIALEGLNDRHMVLEAHLILEERIDEFLTKLVPDILKSELYKTSSRSALSFEQKISLLGCFFDPQHKEAALKFPKMVQRHRNDVAHNRKYQMDDEKFKTFYKELSAEHRQIVQNGVQKVSRKNKLGVKSFVNLPPRKQFILLILAYLQFLKVEMKRVLSPFV